MINAFFIVLFHFRFAGIKELATNGETVKHLIKLTRVLYNYTCMCDVYVIKADQILAIRICNDHDICMYESLRKCGVLACHTHDISCFTNTTCMKV